MITTVTMELSRFKELESKEKALEKMMNHEITFIHVAYGGEYLFYNYESEALADIRKDIKRIEEYAETWRQKASKCG